MTFQEFMQKLLYLIATTMLPIIILYIITFLKTKVSELNTKISNATLQKYISAATDIISKVVLEVSQTYVDGMKSEGKFDEIAQKVALDKAILKAKELITEEGKKAIELLYGDFQSYLQTQIEAMVHESKK